MLPVSPGVSHFLNLCFCCNIIFWGIFFCPLLSFICFFFMVYLCVFLIVNNILFISKKPTLFPGHMFDVLLSIVMDVLWYWSFCQLNDTFFYLVTLTSHLFYYRLHTEAITGLSCQSSRTIWMMLLVYDLLLGVLWGTGSWTPWSLQVSPSLRYWWFYVRFFVLKIHCVRQWEGLVWISAMLLRNWTFISLTSILKGNLSDPRVSIFKMDPPSPN